MYQLVRSDSFLGTEKHYGQTLIDNIIFFVSQDILLHVPLLNASVCLATGSQQSIKNTSNHVLLLLYMHYRLPMHNNSSCM